MTSSYPGDPRPGDDGMPRSGDAATPPADASYVVRVPPWQSSLVFLVAALAAALALYSQLNTGARFFAALVALSAAAAGVLTARAYLVADSDGVSLRTLRPRFYPWTVIDSVEVVVRKNQPRLFLLREERGNVAIPSFLLLPLTPAGLGKTLDRLNTVAALVAERRPTGRAPV